jgi:hemin uptake protein HemP
MNNLKTVSLRSLYQTIGKHIGQPFIITNFNKPVAMVNPIDEQAVIISSEQLKDLEANGKISFSYNGQVYLVSKFNIND